ncbi:MAG: ferritin-like domain-containing protein [Planctomycetes bacterium]|nr:ferritin-like domain-containing protein [Planctomycetota bacterium]
MAAGSVNYHEPLEKLSDATLEQHRGLVSLMEELEAVDWYQQRIDATGCEELKKILAHNRDEEKEHAAMALEWLRRRDPALDAKLRTYLFTEESIAEIEEETEAPGNGAATGSDGSLGIGSLKRG